MHVLLKFGKTGGIINCEIGNTDKTNWKTKKRGLLQWDMLHGHMIL